MSSLHNNKALINTVVAIILLIFGAFISDSRLNPDISSEVLGTDTTVYTVSSIVDGDTIKISDSWDQYTIRLIGIDTPETKDPRKEVECFGEEATLHLTKLIENQNLILKSDSTQDDIDRYGRLLRYVFLEDGTNINLEMIKNSEIDPGK